MASSILLHQQTDRERAIMLNTKETVNSCFWSDNNHDNMTLRKNIFLELRIVRPIRTARPNMRHALQTLSKHRPPWFVTSTHIKVKAKHATCGFKRFRRIAILNSKLSFRPSKRRPWCLSEPRDPPSSKHVLDYLVFPHAMNLATTEAKTSDMLIHAQPTSRQTSASMLRLYPPG